MILKGPCDNKKKVSADMKNESSRISLQFSMQEAWKSSLCPDNK